MSLLRAELPNDPDACDAGYDDPVVGAKSVIFDIDGTLSDATHRVHLLDARTAEASYGGPNWEAFLAAAAADTTKPAIVELVHATRARGFRTVLITGRQADQRQMTIGWLVQHGIPFDELHMRPSNDPRPDTEIKLEIFDRLRAAGYDFLFAVEDRKSVTKMWREQAGIMCLQVCEGDY